MRAPLLGFLLLLAGCGGSSDADAGLPDGAVPDSGVPDGDGGVSIPTPRRVALDVTTATFDVGGWLTFTQPADTVELVALTLGDTPRLWRMEVGADTPTAVLDLTHPPDATDSEIKISAARGVDGALHVVWESAVGDVGYATDASGAWTESTVARGAGPSIALHADGTPYVAFVQRSDAVVAHLEGAAWVTETVASVGTTAPWTWIANGGGPLVLAGTVGDGQLWLRYRESSGWVERPIDLSEATFMNRSHNYAMAAGPVGVVLGLESNQVNWAAYVPAGSSTAEVLRVGPTFELNLMQTWAAAGDERVYVGGIDDVGQRLGILSRGSPAWPFVGAVPWDFTECGEHVALGIDTADQPILAAFCGVRLYVFRTVGQYPDDWVDRCERAVTALCDQACACGSPEDVCGFTSPETGQDSGNRAGCELAAREALCSNSTRADGDLTACLATFDTPAACVTDGYPLPDACVALHVVE
jgi:hypothetical protein